MVILYYITDVLGELKTIIELRTRRSVLIIRYRFANGERERSGRMTASFFLVLLLATTELLFPVVTGDRLLLESDEFSDDADAVFF